MKKIIYADHAATTPVDERVIKVMLPFFKEKFGNPSVVYDLGVEAKKAIEKSRNKIAELINASPDEIFFTSGGTESDNWAIKGIAEAYPEKKHIITSNIEHHAVLNPIEWLEAKGYEVTYIKVDAQGLINPEDVEKTIRKDTLMVSIMHANNEIGTIEPIEEIGRICREKNVIFHTDAVQTLGKLSIDVKKMNIDLLSASSHKIYGPKGVGMLYVRKGIEIAPLIHGGGQERKMRSGTENVPGIVGFAKALEIAHKNMNKENEKLKRLTDYLKKEILSIEGTHLNGHSILRVPGNLNFWFEGIEGEGLIMLLNEEGICASTGSACSTSSLKPSHVLTAIGISPEHSHGSLRLTLGRSTTLKDIKFIAKIVKASVEKLRNMSVTWRK